MCSAEETRKCELSCCATPLSSPPPAENLRCTSSSDGRLSRKRLRVRLLWSRNRRRDVDGASAVVATSTAAAVEGKRKERPKRLPLAGDDDALLLDRESSESDRLRLRPNIAIAVLRGRPIAGGDDLSVEMYGDSVAVLAVRVLEKTIRSMDCGGQGFPGRSTIITDQTADGSAHGVPERDAFSRSVAPQGSGGPRQRMR